MAGRILTDSQERYLVELYNHISSGRSEGMFRSRFEEGCDRRLWNISEVIQLGDNRLIEVNEPLLISGMGICASLTGVGRKYAEALLN